jgi:hypothetical protein
MQLTEGLLQVDVVDASGDLCQAYASSYAGREAKRIFATGLNPAISPGYADYVMQPGIQYSLQAGTVKL